MSARCQFGGEAQFAVGHGHRSGRRNVVNFQNKQCPATVDGVEPRSYVEVMPDDTLADDCAPLPAALAPRLSLDLIERDSSAGALAVAGRRPDGGAESRRRSAARPSWPISSPPIHCREACRCSATARCCGTRSPVPASVRLATSRRLATPLLPVAVGLSRHPRRTRPDAGDRARRAVRRRAVRIRRSGHRRDHLAGVAPRTGRQRLFAGDRRGRHRRWHVSRR